MLLLLLLVLLAMTTACLALLLLLLLLVRVLLLVSNRQHAKQRIWVGWWGGILMCKGSSPMRRHCLRMLDDSGGQCVKYWCQTYTLCCRIGQQLSCTCIKQTSDSCWCQPG